MAQNSLLATVKSDLPEFPDEVIEIWLSTFVRRFGWPPSAENDWRFILRETRDLEYLKKMRWKKELVALKPDMLDPYDLQICIGLFKSHVLNQKTLFSITMSDGRERFESIKTYLKDFGIFPVPIILGRSENNYKILDGNHRVTAFLYLYGYFNIENDDSPCLKVKTEQMAWIATSV